MKKGLKVLLFIFSPALIAAFTVVFLPLFFWYMSYEILMDLEETFGLGKFFKEKRKK